MADNTEALLSVIREYLQTVYNVVDALQRKYESVNLLVAWRRGLLPQNGEFISDQTGQLVQFEFHGVGCWAAISDREVDFDFGPDGRVGGFDEWRLSQFIASNMPDLDIDLCLGINELKDRDVVVSPGWEPSPHLLYLVASEDG